MRKTALYVTAWFAAGAFAVTLASVGVSMVSDRVTDDDRAPALSAAEVQDQLDGTTGGDPELATPDTTSTTVRPDPVVTVDGEPSTSGTTPTPPTSTPSGGQGPNVNVNVTTTTIAPPVAPAAETRTYAMVGGTATLRFTAAGVTVVGATPKAGYSVKISDVHDGGARVEFEGESHRSRVDGWWESGPRDEVREED